jgi:toxin ParE1/3/4
VPAPEWRVAARADLLAIVDYISDDNPDAAQRLKDEIEEKFPGCPITRDSTGQGVSPARAK